MRTQRLVDIVGPDPVIQSWGYADAYLRMPELRAPSPLCRFYYNTRTGLWCAASSRQQTKNSANGTPLSTDNFSLSCVSGNVIILFIGYHGSFDNPPGTPSDTLGTIYTSRAVALNAGTSVRVYSGILTGSGTNKVSSLLNFPGNAGIFAVEVTGVSGATPDTTATGTGTTKPATSGSFTTSAAGDYISVGAVWDNGFNLQNPTINGAGIAVLDNSATLASQGTMGIAENIPAGTYSGVTATYDTVSGSGGVNSGIVVVALMASGGAVFIPAFNKLPRQAVNRAGAY